VAEILSAGVFIEEVPSQVQVIQGVSTSTVGGLGYSPKGPENLATLVTSFDDYTRKFGALTQESFLGHSMAAYFANGGRRAYIVRVVPGDATLAEAKIQSKQYDYEAETGDGTTTAFSKTAITTGLKVNDGDTPIVPESVEIRWRELGSSPTSAVSNASGRTGAVVGDGSSTKFGGQLPDGRGADGRMVVTAFGALQIVDGDTFTLDDGINTPTVFEFDDDSSVTAGNVPVDISAVASTDDVAEAMRAAINGVASGLTLKSATQNASLSQVDIYNTNPGTAGNVTSWAENTTGGAITVTQPTGGVDGPGLDEALFSYLGGSVTLKWEAGGTPRTAVLSVKIDRWTYATAATPPPSGVYAIMDCRTGVWSLRTAVAIDANSLVTADYDLASDTKTATDDGAGNITGDVAAASVVDYDDGSYTLNFSTAPIGPTGAGNGGPILWTYNIYAWDLDPSSRGEWGNDVRLRVKGNVDYYTAETGQFSRFDFQVLEYNSSLQDYSISEPYEELDFSDDTSTKFFADVVNDLSDLVVVNEPGGNEAPGQLQAVPRYRVLVGGDETTGGRTIQDYVGNAPVQPRTFSLTYTSATDDSTRTIIDDGAGNLTGDIDAAGTNEITYSSGLIDVTVVAGHPIKNGTLAVLNYYTEPEETQHDEDFGDTTKGYAEGTNGTFTSTTQWGRNQFTSPTLSPNYEGIFAFNKVDELLQLIVPDWAGDTTITGDILDYCDAREALPHGGDRFAILAVPSALTAQEAVSWFRYTLQRFSKWAALYWPWVKIADPLSDNRDLLIPPLGHIAGIYARTDNDRNVGKAPGGVVDGQLRFVTGLETEPDIEERNTVYPNKINPLIASAATGRAVWGVRTISNQSDWRYISTRRMFMFAERSVYNSTFWIVFENNGPALWTRIKAQLEGFFLNLFNEGILAGAQPSEAFIVTVDSTNNSPESIDAGQVIIDIALAPQKPAEFVRFRFTQKTLT